MYFLSDIASFAKQKKQEEPKRRTLRDNIIGTTNAGKAFRVGALASAAGLGGLALKNKNTVTMLAKKPFVKAGAIGVGALSLPLGLAYLAGDEQDRKDINDRVDKTLGKVNKTSKELRSWTNTLHRVLK